MGGDGVADTNACYFKTSAETLCHVTSHWVVRTHHALHVVHAVQSAHVAAQKPHDFCLVWVLACIMALKLQLQHVLPAAVGVGSSILGHL